MFLEMMMLQKKKLTHLNQIEMRSRLKKYHLKHQKTYLHLQNLKNNNLKN